MGKHYSEEFKNKVLNNYKSGELGGSPQVARYYNISLGTLSHWITKDRIQGNQINDIQHKRGRSKNNNINYKERYEILKKYQTFLKTQRERK